MNLYFNNEHIIIDLDSIDTEINSIVNKYKDHFNVSSQLKNAILRMKLQY